MEQEVDSANDDVVLDDNDVFDDGAAAVDERT